MLCLLHAMVEQTLCNARLGRKHRFGQGLMIRQRMGRTAQTCLRPAHDLTGHSRRTVRSRRATPAPSIIATRASAITCDTERDRSPL